MPAPDFRQGVNHRMRRHYVWASPRGAISRVARKDRDKTLVRIEVSPRVQDALDEQNRPTRVDARP